MHLICSYFVVSQTAKEYKMRSLRTRAEKKMYSYEENTNRWMEKVVNIESYNWQYSKNII